MSEWRLFPAGQTPVFTTVEFFRAHPWVPPADQPGHAERTAMAAALVRRLAGDYGTSTWSDLACGDGSLLAALRDGGGMAGVLAWGWDAGRDNVAHARAAGLDVDLGDITTIGGSAGTSVDIGEGVSACEVLEHMADPHGWLARLASAGCRAAVFTSPSAEDGDWHYEHHAWAWDKPGYEAMVAGAGWRVLEHAECAGGECTFAGVTRPQRFQAVTAEVA